MLDNGDDIHGTLKTSESSTGTATSMCASVYSEARKLCRARRQKLTHWAWHGMAFVVESLNPAGTGQARQNK